MYINWERDVFSHFVRFSDKTDYFYSVSYHFIQFESACHLWISSRIFEAKFIPVQHKLLKLSDPWSE